jgi:hypothetical protein
MDVYLLGLHLMGVHLVGVRLMGMYLMGVHLMGMYFMGVHLMDMYLMGVHLMGMYFMGVHLMDMYLIGVYLMGMYLVGMPLTRHAPHERVPYGRASHWVCTSWALSYVLRDLLKALLLGSKAAIGTEKNLMSVYRGIVTRFFLSLSDRATRG